MTIYAIADILTGLIEAVMMFMLYGTFCFKRENLPVWVYGAGVVVLTLMINISNLIFSTSVFNIVCMEIACFIVSYLYKGRFIMRIIIAVLSYLLMGIAELVVLYAITVIYGVTVSEVTASASYRLLGIIVSKALSFFTVYLVHHKFGKSKINLGMSYWISMFVMFLCTTVAVFLLFKLSYSIEETYLFNASILCSFGLLFTTFLALYLCEHLAKQAYIINTHKENEKYLKAQMKHFDEILITQNQIKKFKHDYNNFVIGIQAYIDNSDYAGAGKYLDNLKASFNYSEGSVETGNIALDAVLSTKKKIAESKGIRFETKIQIPPDIPMDPTDICIVFGNALDNATEACERTELTSKKISVTLVYKNDTLFCKIANTAPEHKNKLLRTSKADTANHGFGLENIKTTLEKYNSCPDIDYNKNEFVLKFVIFDGK